MRNDLEIEEYSIDSVATVESEIGPANDSIKKGDKQFQSKSENIHIIQEQNEDTNLRSNLDFELDDVLSGESLYKTFTFEQSSNDEDVEKCISFWKSVMNKNLEPIKCSIIADSKIKLPPESEKATEDDSEEKKITEARQKVHESYRNIWESALRDIQKRKLNKYKLINKSRCKMCEAEISSSEPVEPIATKKELAKLNKWVPKRGHPIKLKKVEKEELVEDTTSKQPVIEEPVADDSKSPSSTCICKPPDEAIENVSSVDTIISDRCYVPPDTTRYKLIDVINEKKKTGAYSKWRKNTLQPCICRVAGCDCAVNPAIVSIKPVVPPQLQKNCGCGLALCRCETESEFDTPAKVADDTNQEDKQELEESKVCPCGQENCTCSRPVSVESQIALEADDQVSSENPTIASQDTFPSLPADQLPTTDMYYTEPVKRDVNADVTGHGNGSSSQSTRSSKSDKCSCKIKDCNCIDKITKQRKPSKRASKINTTKKSVSQ